MFDNGIFGWFKSSKEERAPERKWDPKTVTMEQPTSPPAPSTERVVTEQPVRNLFFTFLEYIKSARSMIDADDVAEVAGRDELASARRWQGRRLLWSVSPPHPSTCWSFNRS